MAKNKKDWRQEMQATDTTRKLISSEIQSKHVSAAYIHMEGEDG
jgi:hypothetical protein